MNTKTYIMRLPQDLRDMLQAQADNKGLKLAAYIKMILTERAKLERKGKL